MKVTGGVGGALCPGDVRPEAAVTAAVVLLCRGKAIADFSGPDCRFLKVKTSETIYVYYKLSGRRADIWAGSVGSHFGYFPNHLLAVNHRYTDKEIEVPAEV
ncbi:Melanoma inhibitory activity protein 3 [Liparis tanakae]|uniref:Melanoma inhibitory activity protein 3 n=1 Tax=Liparis tanakae TaxID=230148 RepID=A0A4Z2IDY8_9TELE|nr:Melanoma inhibitory activity protein 3 [Liparis tanakae]